jgi:hypothetical protein
MKKPKVKLVGQDGNVFNLLGICSKALKQNGQSKEAEEMSSKIFACESYNEALQIIMEYCDVN